MAKDKKTKKTKKRRYVYRKDTFWKKDTLKHGVRPWPPLHRPEAYPVGGITWEMYRREHWSEEWVRTLILMCRGKGDVGDYPHGDYHRGDLTIVDQEVRCNILDFHPSLQRCSRLCSPGADTTDDEDGVRGRARTPDRDSESLLQYGGLLSPAGSPEPCEA